MNNDYKQKEEEIKEIIFDILTLTDDKHLIKDLIFNMIAEHLNVITDIINNT